MPNKLLVPNPIDRYLINSPMLPQLTKDKDGGLTLYLQANSPDKESIWLPAPKGSFFVVLRIYWPKPEAVDGTWKQPPLMPGVGRSASRCKGGSHAHDSDPLTDFWGL